MSDTRGIRELAEEFRNSDEYGRICDTTYSVEEEELQVLTAFAESIVEQCCKVEIRHVDILCAPERWDVLLNGKRVHYFGYEHEAEELKEKHRICDPQPLAERGRTMTGLLGMLFAGLFLVMAIFDLRRARERSKGQ